MIVVSKHRCHSLTSIITVPLFILVVHLFINGCGSSEKREEIVPKTNWNTQRLSKITVSTAEVGYKPILLPKAILNRLINNRMRIDAQGYIYGSIANDNYSPGKAVRWKADSTGVITGPVYLGELPDPYTNADQTIQNANGTGTAVGYAEKENTFRIGIIFMNGDLKKLPEPAAKHHGYAAYDINDEGVVVGQTYIVENDMGISYGIAWFPPYDKRPVLLPRVKEYDLNAARSINNNGVITGFLRCSGSPDMVVKWIVDTQGNVMSGPDIIVGSEGILMTDANETLDFVGLAKTGSSTSKIYRSNLDRSFDLSNPDDKLRSFAMSINERSYDGSLEIAGLSDLGYAHATSGVYWKVSTEGVVTGPIKLELPKSINNDPPYLQQNFVSSGAYSINSQGWIVGWSKTEDGTMLGTLWQPKSGGNLDIQFFNERFLKGIEE